MVCVKVMKIDTSKANKVHIDLSMLPKDIQADFNHRTVTANIIMCVAVAEHLENRGYVIETGVENLRGFLPETKNSLTVGCVYFCRVKKAVTSATASTITFELANDTKDHEAQFAEPNVNHILPGIVVNFKVTKLLKDGLQGTILDDSLVAYINEHQLGYSEPKHFEVNSKIRARVLYIMPLTKIVYLSLNLQNQYADKNILPVGAIEENAVVSHIGTGGIILKLPNAKGIVSLKSLKSDIKTNFDMEKLLEKYQANTVHRCRLLHYDLIDMLYVCSVDPKIINEKYFCPADINTGEFANATIKRALKDGRYAIQVGHIKGYIHPNYLSKTTPVDKLQPNRKLKCRVLCKNQGEKEEIYCTNLKEFMDLDASILTANETFSRDKVFLGLVKRLISGSNGGWLIEFFDYLNGMIYKNQLNENELRVAEKFHEGQIIKVVIKFVRSEINNKKHITLGLADFLTDIGGIYTGRICNIHQTGLDVAFDCDFIGHVPIMNLSDFSSLIPALHRSYRCNDLINTIGIAQNCFSVRDADIENVKKFSEIKVGDIIPAFIKNISNDLIDVQCLIKDFRSTVSIHLKMFIENSGKPADISFIPGQKVYVRILAKNPALKTITCSALLNDVWAGNFQYTVEMMRGFFKDFKTIETRINAKNSIKGYRVGQLVDGILIECDRLDSNNQPMRLFLLDNGAKLYVTKSNDATKKKEKDKKYKILIIWIDYSNEILYGTLQHKYLERANVKHEEEKAGQQLLSHKGFKANVLLTLEDLIIVYPTKWTNSFVYIPTRVHYNDFQPLITKGISEGMQVNVSVIGILESNNFIGMIHSLYELYSRKICQSLEFINLESQGEHPESNKTMEIVLNNQKRKAEKRKAIKEPTVPKTDSKKKQKKKQQRQVKINSAEDIVINTKSMPDMEFKQISSKKRIRSKFSLKSDQIDGAIDLANTSSDEDENEGILPGVSNFWSTDLNVLDDVDAEVGSERSSEDELYPSKKRKFTSKQRFDAARSEETRIREIEKSLAFGSFSPFSIDQFERLVLFEPNSSRVWINYMVLHVQTTEIDRARAIGKKALKTIDIREEQERLNVWVSINYFS